MKIRILFVFCLILATVFAERDFRPVGRMENIPASDISVQQCYLFPTIPGVIYRVESSHDLTTWTAGDEFYGMGHEHVVAMRDFTPPPPPPPGGGAGQPPSNFTAPARHVGLRMSPSSGMAGGSVVSWRSLDNAAPVNMLLAQTMAAEWNGMPFFSERYGSHYFFIGCGSLTPLPPPEANPVLGPKDAAMFAQLETSFPLMNQAVIESTARARIIPPSAPPDPMSRKFWRVFCDWGVDTDMDGSPDWAEFEISGIFADGLRGDAFDADTNHNGILDGNELDLDQDGFPDIRDPDIGGGDGNGQDAALVIWKRTPGFQFAAFELPLPEDALEEPDLLFLDDLSENGTVLYTTLHPASHSPESRILIDRNLSAHVFPHNIQPLTEVVGDFQSYAMALLGDNMLGLLAVGSGEQITTQDHIWDPLAVAPAQEYTPYEFPNYYDSILDDRGGFRVTRNVYGSDPLLHTPHGNLAGSENDGQAACIEKNGNIITDSGYWRFNATTGQYGTKVGFPEAVGGNTATLVQTETGANNTVVTNKWNFAAGLSGLVVAAEDGDFALTKVRNPKGQTPVGVSNQGWLATDRAIWNYDQWKPLSRYLTNMQRLIRSEMLRVMDNGMSIASLEQLNYEITQPNIKTHNLLMPVSVDAVDLIHTPPDPGNLALGVDRISMLADDGTGLKSEIWVMAPIGGGSTQVRFNIPASTSAPVTLQSVNNKFEVQPSSVNAQETQLSFTGIGADTQDDSIRLIRQGNKHAKNQPVRVKTMKKRVVKIALHKVFGVAKDLTTAAPLHCPTEAALEEYLNKIYEPQVNVTFDVTLYDEGTSIAGVDFDKNHDGEMWVDRSSDKAEFTAAMPNPKSLGTTQTANIDVWVFGGKVSIMRNLRVLMDMRIQGMQDYPRPWILVDGDLDSSTRFPEEARAGSILNTIAHEIGHVMTNDFHPGEVDHRSTLEFGATKSDPYVKKRLMCAGPESDVANPGTCLIKNEWDRIESWLKKQEDDGKL
jgi:hypothetical protein